ncbi:MAG: hypothetical protein ACTSO9_12185 [Candidatus Helarchaeota archaeon]
MSNKDRKIEISFDEKGNVKKLTFGEDVATSKIMEIVNNLRNLPKNNLPSTTQETHVQSIPKEMGLEFEDLSIMDKLLILIKQIKYGWFTSRDIQDLYKNEYGEEVRISTISTYLSRLFEDGVLDRRGSRKRREFQLISEKIVETTPIQE